MHLELSIRVKKYPFKGRSNQLRKIDFQEIVYKKKANNYVFIFFFLASYRWVSELSV